MNTKRRPDWNLCVKEREGEHPWSKIGAGWTNDKGNISIHLDHGQSLPDTKRFMLYLFKVKDGEFGYHPKGSSRNVRRGESMRSYFARRKEEVREGKVESGGKMFEGGTPPSIEPDYMDSLRGDRMNPEPPPQDPPYDPSLEKDAPEWL